MPVYIMKEKEVLCLSGKRPASALNNFRFSKLFFTPLISYLLSLKCIVLKKIFCLYFFVRSIVMPAMAQPKEDSGQSHEKGKCNSLSLGPDIPFDIFSDTHKYGPGLDYSWSNHRFGKLNVLPKKLIGFIFNSGIDYYFGKKENVAGYNYRYGGYSYLHAYGGAIYNPCKRGNISLTAGPALSLYAGNLTFEYGVNLAGSYYLNENIAITPMIVLMKHADADPLWAGTIRVTFSF